MLLEARTLRHAFPPVTLRELQLAQVGRAWGGRMTHGAPYPTVPSFSTSLQDELDNRAACSQLAAAIAAGAVTGPVGHVDVAAVDVAALDAAVAYARSLGVRSAEAVGLVDTAVAIRGLRAGVLSGDWPATGQLLDSLAGEQRGGERSGGGWPAGGLTLPLFPRAQASASSASL